MDEEQILASPAWYPLRVINQATMEMVHLTDAAYQAASFLDERLVAGRYVSAQCQLPTLAAAAAKIKGHAHYVFHTGHAGSTLISRLIGTYQAFFSLREPALLRCFADGPTAPPTFAEVLPLADVLALLSRSWDAGLRAVIKVTSVVNDNAELILAADHEANAIMMFTTALAYLRSIFGGPNSRLEARALAALRMRRLSGRLKGIDQSLLPASEGEYIAMSWLCEMTAMHAAALRCPERVSWLNFDDFLAAPTQSLHTILNSLGARPSTQEVEALIASPIMTQYSKAPEHAYDAGLRREVLMSADYYHGPEIKRGMEWLGKLVRSMPALQAIFQQS